MSAVLDLLKQLIACPSVTPQDRGCMDIIVASLRPLGFEPHFLEFGHEDSGRHARVRNLWLYRPGDLGEQAKTFVFAGHTDVVPPGPLEAWTSPPFEPTIRGGLLYGRGTSDMKASLAAFTVAIKELLGQTPAPRHNIALLLTSDEEGPSIHGTIKVCEWLTAKNQRLDWCIVGEPTSLEVVGDTLKNGRRGTMGGKLVVHGVQGHVAYPHQAKNPVHMVAPALAQLAATTWDEGNQHFDATSFQVSNIHSGTGASNVIPGECVVDFNFRFCTESSAESLQRRVQEILHLCGLQAEDYTLEWVVGGQPFLTPQGALVEVMQKAIAQVQGVTAKLSTSGGTSDGRFIARICPQVVELGPTNASIHKVNEYVPLADLEPLSQIYCRILKALVA